MPLTKESYRVKKCYIPCSIVAAIVVSATAHAQEAMRCGQSLVTQSASLDVLVQKCGEPTTKQVTTEDVLANTGIGVMKVGTTTIEKWTYATGTQSLPRIVTVVDGKITAIEIGKR